VGLICEYAVEMGSGAMIYIPSFIKFGSGVQKLMGGGGYTDTQDGDRIRLVLFLENKRTRLKIIEMFI
jgi:hypothetical protein